MSHNKSPHAINHLRVLFDRALEQEHGLVVTCKSHGEAMALRSRLHWLRQRDREANAITYAPEHPLHKQSAWEGLVCRINDNVLTIAHLNIDHLHIEPLKGPNDEPTPTVD